MRFAVQCRFLGSSVLAYAQKVSKSTYVRNHSATCIMPRHIRPVRSASHQPASSVAISAPAAAPNICAISAPICTVAHYINVRKLLVVIATQRLAAHPPIVGRIYRRRLQSARKKWFKMVLLKLPAYHFTGPHIRIYLHNCMYALGTTGCPTTNPMVLAQAWPPLEYKTGDSLLPKFFSTRFLIRVLLKRRIYLLATRLYVACKSENILNTFGL